MRLATDAGVRIGDGLALSPKLRWSLVPGAILGLLLLAACLIVWRWLSDAAGLFAPTFAIVGSVCLNLAQRGEVRRLMLGAALRGAGTGAVLLSVLAALSAGAFLPSGVALWMSPVLGRFGGGLALSLLAVTLASTLRRGSRPAWQLDLCTLLGIGAWWVWTQTVRQVAFPPPPTTERMLMPRLVVLLLLAAGLGLAAVLLRRSRPNTAHWCRRWSLLAITLGAVLGTIAQVGARWVLAALLLTLLAVLRRCPWLSLWRLVRAVGWWLLLLIALAMLYAMVSEDLEIVLLRNTVEHRSAVFWRGLAGDDHAPVLTNGTMAGLVRDSAGRPLDGASVVVADASGQVFTAVTGPDGRYQLPGVPAGNYLPLAVAPAYRQGGRTGLAGRVATIRAGMTTTGIDFRLSARPANDPSVNESLIFGEQTEVTYAGLVEGTVLRRPFTFANKGPVLDGGLVHEPSADQGPGPFPILLIIYPGEAASWEGVSAPLATEGFVVVSYFPRRLLDLDGDLDDLRLLLNLTASGHLSARGDGARIVLVGGSVSTVYTYLLARATADTPAGAHVRALIQYGGLFDLYTFRRSWESGQVVIDPGISELEYLLVAFGRPDSRPELYLRLSPRFGLGPGGLPPTLLTHAEKDIIVPPEQSHLAAAGLAEVHIAYQLLLYPELEHYLDVSKQDPAQLDMLERTVAFLRQWTTLSR